MAGKHHDAILRVDGLISTVYIDSFYYVVQARAPISTVNNKISHLILLQAYMHLFLGNLHMERSNYEDAIRLFKRARAQMCHSTSPLLVVVSLVCFVKVISQHIEIAHRL